MKKTIAFAMCLIALPALAHPGHSDAVGFTAGLLHPLTGIDHLLAMLGIGMWSRKQEQTMAMPLTFLFMMALGASIQTGLVVPETWIAASVVMTGLLLAALRLPPAAAIGVVAVFALLHGQVHGRELPELASAAGFMITSAALLLVGRKLAVMRMAGWAIAGAGLCLLAGVA